MGGMTLDFCTRGRNKSYMKNAYCGGAKNVYMQRINKIFMVFKIQDI